MTEAERKKIEIPEICRVEGHSAVEVQIDAGKVSSVKLDVFEGTRFFEKIAVDHKYDEMPHLTSRVCAICSTGHVLAAIFAIESGLEFNPGRKVNLYRELMHLGMIIESHATHVCALALPDFLGVSDLHQFAGEYPEEFGIWTKLRNLGSLVQTVLGGRPFHPINLHVGGFSKYPGPAELKPLLEKLDEGRELALRLAEFLLDLKLPFEGTAAPGFIALIPSEPVYSYFGNKVRSSDGWEAPITEYKEYLKETVVSYSHAKRSLAKGKTVMVGALARLHFFADRLGKRARQLYECSPMVSGNFHTILNNLSQSIEIVDAIDRASTIILELSQGDTNETMPDLSKQLKAATCVGAVECPRGTLYHSYTFDKEGTILAADLLTPSAQNTARIEEDIRNVVDFHLQSKSELLDSSLETLVRAYDPCNTCATHMVRVKYSSSSSSA